MIVLAGGAFYTQQLFVESSAPSATSGPAAQTADFEESSSVQPLPATTPTPTKVTQTPQPAQSNSFTFTAKARGTVLEAMNELVAEGKLSFSGREFAGLGLLVEEINGKRSAAGYYWILHINGILSEKGVSQAQIMTGDVVEWRYEKGY